MTKFIILAEIRTGYKWLATSLSSHHNAFCFGEIFGSSKPVRQMSMFTMPLKCIEKEEDPVIWLKDNVEKWAENQNLHAVGFKLNYIDGKFLDGKDNKNRWNNLWEYVSSGEYKVIHLTRANLIDRALSELLAIKESNWGNLDYKSKIHIDLNNLIKIIHRSEYWQTQARKMFDVMFEVTYEDLQSMPKKFDEIQQYLGLTARLLSSNQRKQRRKSQSHYIENYNEIYRMIKIHFPHYSNMLDHPEIKM